MYGSKDVSKRAIILSLTSSREQEREMIDDNKKLDLLSAAVDCGGEFLSSISKFVERAVVAAKREGVIGETHAEQGAVAGATHEALTQIGTKAIGLNVGGKIAICRSGDHISVAVFFEIGLLNLNEVSVGLGHRVI